MLACPYEAHSPSVAGFAGPVCRRPLPGGRGGNLPRQGSRHPRRGGLPDQQTKLRLHEPHPEKSAGGAGARGNIRFEHARRPGLGDQRDDDEKHPAAHHSHLRLRKPQGHVRRGAHLRGVRQNLHGSRLLHRRSGHHHLIRRGNGSRHAQESGKRLLGLYPLRRDGKGLPPGSGESHDDPVRPGTAVRPRQTGKRRAPDPDGQGSRRASERRQAPAGPGHSLLRHGPAGPGESKCPRGHGGTYGL